MAATKDAISGYEKSAISGERAKVKVSKDDSGETRVERLVARFDAGGDRIDDAVYPVDLADLERQRASHQEAITRLDVEIAAVKAAIAAAGGVVKGTEGGRSK